MSTKKETVRTLLTKQGLSEKSVLYIERIVRIFSEKSGRLPDDLDLGGKFSTLLGIINPQYAIHIYGHPSSGKTALLCDLVNRLCKGINVLWLDTTFTFPDNLIDCKDTVYVLPSAHIEPAVEIAANYGVVVIDNFGSIRDPRYITDLIGVCKQNSTLLLASNQIREFGRVPMAMRANLTTLFDVTLKMQRAEIKHKAALYQCVVERDKFRHENKHNYGLIEITDGGKVIWPKDAPIGKLETLTPNTSAGS
jgi:hypothetical protein